jgi:hypothetical protein
MSHELDASAKIVDELLVLIKKIASECLKKMTLTRSK